MAIVATYKLTIPYLADALLADNQDIDGRIKLAGVSLFVDKINWLEFPFKPTVKVFTAYSEEFLWICFEVKGDFFRAKATVDQEAVWEDSCVEFFISTGDKNAHFSESDAIYRNFEFNVLGVCLSAFGTKSNREMLSTEEMKQILRFPSIERNNLLSEGDCFDWNLCVAIPLKLLGLEPGSSFTANFYKCGDLTTHPHFLSWSCIDTADPDFHLPQFFGVVELGKS